MRHAGWILGILIAQQACALSWKQLWMTSDQEAQQFLQQGQYDQAEKTFRRIDWQAVAAYRAGHYADAAKGFASMQNEQGYYNQGNALAKLGRYADAIKAYDEALRLNSSNQDAKANRQLIEALLKKQQANRDANKEQQAQQSTSPQQNEQNKSSKEASHSKSDSNAENNSDTEPHSNAKTSANANSNSSSNPDSNQSAQHQQQTQATTPTSADEQKQEQQTNARSSTAKQLESMKGAKREQVARDREKHHAKEQWMRLIPDEPGGLLREKFLREHLRRQGESS